MKTADALNLLKDSLDGYRFKFHPKFVAELIQLLKKELKGKENSFFKCLTVQFENIKNFGNMINTVDGHEVIQGFDGRYYSIHVQNSFFNIRFLVHIDVNSNPTFLCAFYERSGHRVTDYSQYTKILKERFTELQGDEENE